MNDQARRLRELAGSMVAMRESGPADARLRAVAITSGKGGVGKTNIALMLGIALASLGKKVLLFDADLGLANVHILLGLAPVRTLRDVVEGECRIEDIVCTGPAGIGIVPGASGIEAMANAGPSRLLALHRSLERLESRYDFVIIDTSAGIGAGATGFAAHADLCMCVLTPEPTSLADAYAMVKVLCGKNVGRLEIMVNMASSDKEGRQAFETLDRLTRRFLNRSMTMAGLLPIDHDLPKMVRRQRVLTVEKPGSAVAARVNACARRLCGIPAGGSGYFSRMLGLGETLTDCG